MTSPTDAQIKKALELIGRGGASSAYFFEKLNSPAWIGPLHAKGFFRSPAPARRTGDLIEFPVWPESRCLVRILEAHPAAADVVLEVLLKLPSTDNDRVLEDVIDSALLMPGSHAARVASWLGRVVEPRTALYLNLGPKTGRLVGHLATSQRGGGALALAGTLLTPMRTEGTGRPTSRLIFEVPTKLRGFDYEGALELLVAPLVEATGLRGLDFLSDILDRFIEQSLSSPHPPNDLSYSWRAAVEEHEQNRSAIDLKSKLVASIRDAAEALVEAGDASLGEVVEFFEGRKWSISQRIALHLLRVAGSGEMEMVGKRLTDPGLFHESGCRHEFMTLMTASFGRVSAAEQASVLALIDAGPHVAHLRRRWVDEDESEDPHREERRRRCWQRDWLHAISDNLPASRQEELQKLIREGGDPNHPEFPVFSSGVWHGPTSPKEATDLAGMSAAELVGFLSSWAPGEELRSSSPEGLSRTLAAAVAEDPERFSVLARDFRDLEPEYVRAVFDGLRQAVSGGKSFRWEEALMLAASVLRKPAEPISPYFRWNDRDPGWIWTRKSIAALLGEGLRAEECSVPHRLRADVFSLIDELAKDPNPPFGPHESVEKGERDPAEESINTVRGEALHAAVRYALWVRHELEREEDAAGKLSGGLDSMPELRILLDRHLDPAHDASPAVRSVYGQWFPWLVLVDPGWAAAASEKVFSRDDLGTAAWSTYLRFCRAYTNVYLPLRSRYASAVEDLASLSGSDVYEKPEQHLGEHLIMLHLWGALEAGGDVALLDRFFELAPDQLRMTTIDFVARSLYHAAEDGQEVSDEIVERLKPLAMKRLAEAEAAKSPAAYSHELSAFGWWVAAPCFEECWVLDLLLRVLRLTRRVMPDHLVAGRLVAVSDANLSKAIECFAMLMRGTDDRWVIGSFISEALELLERGVQSGDDGVRQQAVRVAHEMEARSHHGFRKIWDLYNSDAN